MRDRGIELRPMISWVSIDHHDITREKQHERDRHTVHAVNNGGNKCGGHEQEPFQGLKNRLG